VVDYSTVADVLAEWWARDADPAEIVARYLGEVWDGNYDQLVLCAMKEEDKRSTIGGDK
jgi:hypothetical protein